MSRGYETARDARNRLLRSGGCLRWSPVACWKAWATDEQGCLVIESSGEGHRARSVSAVALAESHRKDDAGMAGQVRDRQVLPRADVEVDDRHALGHRLHELGAHAGRPEIFDGRDELALTERVGPGVQALP